MRSAFLSADARGTDQHRQRLKAQFSKSSTIDLLSDHLRRNLDRTRSERHAIWQEMVRNLEPEIALLTHLEKSAKAPGQMGAWLGSLLAVTRHVHVSVLYTDFGEPIAWSVSGMR